MMTQRVRCCEFRLKKRRHCVKVHYDGGPAAWIYVISNGIKGGWGYQVIN